MIVNVKAYVNGVTPEFVFLQLIEVESQSSTELFGQFRHQWRLASKGLDLICSDGTSVVMGKKSSVASRQTTLTSYYWCMNHHLELTVSDAVDEVQLIHHFKAFMEKIQNI